MASGDELERKLMESPAIFQQSLADLDHCRRLCSALGCDSAIVDKLNQCTADQQQIAKQSSVLAKEVYSVWIPGYVSYYDKARLEPNLCTESERNKLATQAEELSRAFSELGSRARDHGGSLHDAQVAAQEKAEEYRQESEEAAANARRHESRMDKRFQEAAEEKRIADEKDELAGNLTIAGWATILLPPVALGLGIGALAVSRQADSAGERADDARRSAERARSLMQDAECKQKEYKKLSMQVSQAQEPLSKLEQICNVIAAFLQSEADKCRSSASTMDSDFELIQLGLGEEVAEGQIQTLRLRGVAFRKYFQSMDLIDANYAVVKPRSYPPIRLPSFDLTLYN